MTTGTTRSRSTDDFARYYDDPVGFARDILHVRLWKRQREIARAVAGSLRVAVRSGHKVGKSRLAAVLALWFVCTRANANVVMTSASARQVRRPLWKEVTKLHRESRGAIGGKLHKVPDAGLQFDDGRSLVGFSTDEPEKMAGLSGEHLFFILDEASGIPEEIFEAIEGNRAGGARVVMFSNPTQQSGTFYDAFHTKREFWVCLHISSAETPNVIERKPLVPGLAGHEWVEEKAREWGTDSPLYQVRVKGDFADQAENAIIGLALVEAANDRWEDTPEIGALEFGVDPARFGDDETVIYPRRGNKAFVPIVLHGQDVVDVAGHVLKAVRELRRTPNEKPRVKIDTAGLGAGVFDILVRSEEIEAIPVNSGEAAVDAEHYANLRAQLSFGVRDWLREGGAIPDDSKLLAELVAPMFSFDTRNRLLVEKKVDVKKRIGRSPDRADGLALAVFNPPTRGPVPPAEPPIESEPRFEEAGRGF
jgi:phage terminase large subunit